MSNPSPVPVEINLRQKSRVLDLRFDDGAEFSLSCEYLRVHSPSAEVQGHGAGQEVLQLGKQNVSITDIESIGNYAIKLRFDDGHDTGIYSWDYLYALGVNQQENWRRYIDALEAAGHKRYDG